MNCWHCGTIVTNHSGGKLSFRATCDKCNSDLHCCMNCKYHKPGMSNDCSVPGTEWVPDREKNNLCEEFSPLGKPPTPKSTGSKQRFEDLFK